MSNKQSSTDLQRDHRFGGDWTQTKLDVLEKYLKAYLNALKNTPFRTAYIDAFAGTGYRTPSQSRGEPDLNEELFSELAKPEPQALRDGSARIALKTSPRFSSYIFIERSAERCAALETLRSEFPDLADAIFIRQGEANQELRALCAKDWRRHRAVLFLDPYGMQVEWRTLEAIAGTKAIDLWLLFPLGIGVNRLVTRSGEIPAAWRNRLNVMLGTQDWEDAFYRDQPQLQQDLFGGTQSGRAKVPTEELGRFFFERLKSLFPKGAVSEPVALKNSANSPLYLLWFAASNGRGAPIALKIAEHILNGVR